MENALDMLTLIIRPNKSIGGVQNTGCESPGFNLFIFVILQLLLKIPVESYSAEWSFSSLKNTET